MVHPDLMTYEQPDLDPNKIGSDPQQRLRMHAGNVQFIWHEQEIGLIYKL